MFKAFHNDPEVKKTYVNRVLAHKKADEIIKGTYWNNGKGCAVGCTIHGSDHKAYEIELGIPQMLAQLEDRLFEGMNNEKAKDWPLRFLKAIKPGQDLSLIGWKFLYWLQTENWKNAKKQKMPADVIAAIKQCADVLVPLTKGQSVDKNAARSAAESAWSAAESAWSGAWSGAWSAAWSARSAAWSESARSAAESAWSAESAESARSAESAAWSAAAYEKMADKIIELIKEGQ